MYTQPEVIEFISEQFMPVRTHVRENHADFERLGERFGAYWTPTVLIIDPDGNVRHRIEGFLPQDEFLAQLKLGVGHSELARGSFDKAERRFREVVNLHPATESAAEALYWAGVAKYKRSNDASALQETAREFTNRYQTSTWAKKASVWGS